MVWAAFDRAVRAVEEHGLEGRSTVARGARRGPRGDADRGFDAERNTFTQHYDTTEVDASLLVLPLVGFVDGDDPRMLGTIEAVEQDLMRDGLLMRYRTETGVDGLPGDEHPFLACSFWLVSAYAAAGRLDDAHALFDRLVGLVNDVGLLSEEYDPGTAGWSATSRRRSATWRWCRRRSGCARRHRRRALSDPAGVGPRHGRCEPLRPLDRASQPLHHPQVDELEARLNVVVAEVLDLQLLLAGLGTSAA